MHIQEKEKRKTPCNFPSQTKDTTISLETDCKASLTYSFQVT